MRACFLFLFLAFASTAFGQRVEDLASARIEAERAHLQRLAVWAGVSLLSGAGLAVRNAASREPLLHGFGLQTAVWGGINALIVTPGLLSRKVPETEMLLALQAERNLHDLLILMTGLNVAYVAVGGTMVLAGHYGVRAASAWRGHGYAIMVQGGMLFVLDAVLLAGSRSRLPLLLEHVSPAVGPDGALGLLLRF